MTVAFIQARIGSSRLPAKVLLPLGNSTVLEHVVRRVRRAQSIDQVWVLTTVSDADTKLVRLCADRDIRVFLGSEADVLDRYYQLAKNLPDVRNIVRVTADCPLIDPTVIDEIVSVHLDEANDYTSNTLRPSFPDGLDAEVFTAQSLATAWNKATLSSEREHVTPFIKKHPELFLTKNVVRTPDLSSYRWTLDEQADYWFLQSVYDHFEGLGLLDFTTDDIVSFLQRNPEIQTQNSHIGRDEGYRKSLLRDLGPNDGQ